MNRTDLHQPEQARTIAVFGATGTQGGAVAKHMNGTGRAVIAIGRDEAKLAALNRSGMTARRLPHFERDALRLALAGAEEAFISLAFAAGGRDMPIAETARLVNECMIEAGVRRAVWTTSWLATEPGHSVSRTFDALRSYADEIKQSPVASVILKPAGYLDNLLTSNTADAISNGSLPYMLPGEFRYRWIACADQAMFAAALLDLQTFPTGEVALGVPATGVELAAAAERALEQPVRYQPISPHAFAAQWREALGPAADSVAKDYLDILANPVKLGLEDDGQSIVAVTGLQYPPLEIFFTAHALRFRQRSIGGPRAL